MLIIGKTAFTQSRRNPHGPFAIEAHSAWIRPMCPLSSFDRGLLPLGNP